MPAADQSLDNVANEGESAQKFCGIVRPIADMGNYTAKHWREVHNVIAEAVEPLGYTLRLVSESDASGVILTEIVTNLYQDEMVIVDVSGRNPNVMFELGMRLAFEKPAIIVVDDDTPFSFDISPVKHIRYPRTLRYGDIVKFKAEVAIAVTATLNAGPEKKNYLQQFGPIKVTELGAQSVEMNAVAHDVQEMKRLMTSFINRQDSVSQLAKHAFSIGNNWLPDDDSRPYVEVELPRVYRDEFFEAVASLAGIADIQETSSGVRVYIDGPDSQEASHTRSRLKLLARRFGQHSIK